MMQVRQRQISAAQIEREQRDTFTRTPTLDICKRSQLFYTVTQNDNVFFDHHSFSPQNTLSISIFFLNFSLLFKTNPSLNYF